METRKKIPAKRGRKAKIVKPEILIRSMTLTPATQDTLDQLQQDACDSIGRMVSHSALARALLLYAERQGEAWARTALFPLVEEELGLGIVWGKKN